MSDHPLNPVLHRITFVLLATVSSSWLIAAEKSAPEPKPAERSSKSIPAQAELSARELVGATAMVPVAEEQPAKIIIDAPLPELLARGMALIQFRTENLRVLPVFGPAAAKVSPRIGHLHVRLDDNPWVWAHTSTDDLIVNRLVAGPHKIQLELADANHKILAQGEVHFEVPQGPHMLPIPGEHDIVPQVSSKGEPPATLTTEPPQPDRLARGVAFIQCRTQNAQIVPVFGTAALEISPRICHLHVTVDDARWRWADTSGGPVILAGLPPGPHKVLIELVNANHKPIASSTVEFEVPQSSKQ